jgi:hypothetical protein
VGNGVGERVGLPFARFWVLVSSVLFDDGRDFWRQCP